MSHSRRLARSLAATLTVVVLSLSGCDERGEPSFSTEELETMALSPAIERAADQSQRMPAIRTRLVRNASAQIEVADVNEAVDAATRSAARLGGVVAESRIASDDEERSAFLLVRVPSESLDALLGALPGLGEVRAVSITSTDVSREYFDTETRLAVQEETVRRLRELIQRSGSIEDLVAVERELSRATSELESMKGQLRYFDLRTAQSDVRLQLSEGAGAFATSAFRPVSRALDDVGSVLAASLAVLVYAIVFLTPWILLALLLTPLARRVVRAVRRRRQPAA